MKRRLIYFVLIVILIAKLFVLSGCDNQEIAPVQTSTANNDDVIEQISFAMLDIMQPQSEGSLAVYSYIKNKFNIDIVPVTLTDENWKSELDWMISTNQLPNVFIHDVTNNKMQYRQMIITGEISPLPKKEWGQLQRLSEVLSWYEDIYAVSGQMYFIPRTFQTFDQTHGASDAIYYRYDWAKDLSSLSFEDEAKLTDIIKLLKAYKTSDPDNNAIWDTWGITGSGGLDFLWRGFLIPFGVREWVYEDGKWIPGLVSDQAKEAIAWAAQLYRDGMIDPEFDTQSQEKAMQKFISGRAGMLLTSAYYSEILEFENQWKALNPNNRITSSVKILPSYTNPMGTIFNEVETFNQGSMVSSNTTSTQMKKILNLFDWMYSQQGRNYITYGQETPLTLENSSTSIFMEDNTEITNLLYLSSWNMDKSPDDLSEDSTFMAYSRDVVENDIWPWSYETELFTNGMVTDEMCILDIDFIAEDKLLNMIKTTRDFDADWEDYVESMYSELNIEAAIEEVNSYVNK